MTISHVEVSVCYTESGRHFILSLPDGEKILTFDQDMSNATMFDIRVIMEEVYGLHVQYCFHPSSGYYIFIPGSPKRYHYDRAVMGWEGDVEDVLGNIFTLLTDLKNLSKLIKADQSELVRRFPVDSPLT